MKKVLNKTLISLILCCMLIACTVLFVSCGEKKTGYDLTQIDEEFKSIKYQNISVDANTNQIIISYSDLLLESGEAYLQSLINNTQTAYSIINNYNAMVQNSVKFASIYIDACSNAKNVNTNLANKTKADLDSLNTSLNNLNKDIIILADRINFVKTTGGDETDEECLSRLEQLLKTYAISLQKCYNFNDDLTSIYFDYCLTNAKKDYTNVGIDSFNENEGLANLNARLAEQVSNLTHSYFENNLKGDEVAEQLTQENKTSFETSFGYAEYKSKLDSINRTYTEIKSEQKQDLLNINILLYNYQAVMANERSMYRKASDSIDYVTVLNDPNATIEQRSKQSIIFNHYKLLTEFNSSISSALARLGV